MRLLFAVVHYFKPAMVSMAGADPQPRIDALKRLILQIHRLFGHPAAVLNHCDRRLDGVDDGSGSIDLRVCVRADCHILDHLNDLKGLFTLVPCETEDPRWLGFSAQDVLVNEFRKAESLGSPYDYIAYLEDDIIINDADFFLKLRLFNRMFGNRYLLMPNRIAAFEVCGSYVVFISTEYNPAATSQYDKVPVKIFCSILDW